MSQFAVIGLGRFGYHLAVSLEEKGGEVLAIDRNMELVEAIKNKVTKAVCIDTMNEEALKVSGVLDVDTVIVGIGERHLENSILTTALLKKIGVGRMIARSTSSIHGQILELIGAQMVFNPEEEMARRLTSLIVSPDIHRYVELASGHSIVEIDAKSSFIGKTIVDLDFRNLFEASIIAIKRKVPYIDADGKTQFREEINNIPRAKDVIAEGDVLVIVGKDEKIRELAEME